MSLWSSLFRRYLKYPLFGVPPLPIKHPKNNFSLKMLIDTLQKGIGDLQPASFEKGLHRSDRSGISKPMVCVRVAFHENDGNHENDEDNSSSYKQGVECWIRGNHGNHENDENHGNPGCKPRVPQTTGLEIPEQTEIEREREKKKQISPPPSLAGGSCQFDFGG